MDGANGLSISPSGLILIPSDSRRLRIMRRNEFEVPRIIRLAAKDSGHTKMISCSDWLEQEIGDPDWAVATGGWDNKICLWRIPSSIISWVIDAQIYHRKKKKILKKFLLANCCIFYAIYEIPRREFAHKSFFAERTISSKFCFLHNFDFTLVHYIDYH